MGIPKAAAQSISPSISFISRFLREITSCRICGSWYSASISSRTFSRNFFRSSIPVYFTEAMVEVPSFAARLKSLSTITPSPISVYLYASSPTLHSSTSRFLQITVGSTQASSRPSTAACVYVSHKSIPTISFSISSLSIPSAGTVSPRSDHPPHT